MIRGVVLGLLGALLCLPMAGQADLTIGQKAPDFALPDETGKVRRLADYRGRTVVLMFYPKDFTPG
jgi:thioredoxin-dependent peroxiredoxin